MAWWRSRTLSLLPVRRAGRSELAGETLYPLAGSQCTVEKLHCCSSKRRAHFMRTQRHQRWCKGLRCGSVPSPVAHDAVSLVRRAVAPAASGLWLRSTAASSTRSQPTNSTVALRRRLWQRKRGRRLHMWLWPLVSARWHLQLEYSTDEALSAYRTRLAGEGSRASTLRQR